MNPSSSTLSTTLTVSPFFSCFHPPWHPMSLRTILSLWAVTCMFFPGPWDLHSTRKWSSYLEFSSSEPNRQKNPSPHEAHILVGEQTINKTSKMYSMLEKSGIGRMGEVVRMGGVGGQSSRLALARQRFRGRREGDGHDQVSTRRLVWLKRWWAKEMVWEGRSKR